MKLYFCLALMFLGVSAENRCVQFPGWLKQIDAGAGHVFGVNDNEDIYRLKENNWVQVPGKMTHVSVGRCGLWGVNRQNQIFKMQGGKWVQTSGALKQLDAGGRSYLVGVNSIDGIYCLNQDATHSKASNLQFQKLEGELRYYACGFYGCWGVNKNHDIFHRLDVNSKNCKGSEWKRVDGKLVMVEPGTDGAVYGVNAAGNVYKREGISASNPIGTHWSQVDIKGSYKHVSCDEGILWLINQEGSIFTCEV